MNNTTKPEFKKALCWELAATNGGVHGFRVIVAGRYVLLQELPQGNERPRWTVEEVPNDGAATQRALDVTKYLETTYAAKLAVEPTEVILHDSELAALHHRGPIPPSLRARVFTALMRKKNAE